MNVEEIPWEQASVAGAEVERDHDQVDAEPVETIAERLARGWIEHISVRPPGGDEQVQGEDERVDEDG